MVDKPVSHGEHQSPSPLQPTDRQSIIADCYRECLVILGLVWRVIVVTFMKKSVDITSYMFLGRLGDTYMAAAGLANVTANVVGNSIIIGLGGPVSTICSQAHGSKNFKLMNETLQRAVLILMVACIPLSVMWIYSYPIMMSLGQSDSIASLASLYLVYLIPGLFAFSYTISLQNWLHAQQLTKAPATIGTITAIIHPMWCYLFVFYFKLGYVGTAVAISTTRMLDGFLLTLYVIISGHLTNINFEFSSAAFTHWFEYLSLGAPNILMTSQWWAEEVIIFLSGTYSRPSRDLAAMSVYQYLIGICFMIPKGLSIIASSRVGFHIGREDSHSGRIAAVTTSSLSLLSVLLESILLITFRNEVGLIFINDKDVIRIVANYLVPVLSVYVLADGIQGNLSGVMNGLGRQKLAGPVVFFCYYLFGIPLAWFLGSDKGYGLGVFGLTIGIAIGTWVHAGLYMWILYKTDWDREIDEARNRVSAYGLADDGKENKDGVELIKREWIKVKADDEEDGDDVDIEDNEVGIVEGDEERE